jgi:hypothetical protein
MNNKKRLVGSDMVFFWTVFAFVGVLAMLITCADDAGADGLTYTWEGTEGVLTFATDIVCDGAVAFFCYPDFLNAYETVELYPVEAESRFAGSSQTGSHILATRGIYGYWLSGYELLATRPARHLGCLSDRCAKHDHLVCLLLPQRCANQRSAVERRE